MTESYGRSGHHSARIVVNYDVVDVFVTSDNDPSKSEMLAASVKLDDWSGAQSELEFGGLIGAFCPNLVDAILAAARSNPALDGLTDSGF